jgi:hypothetical protein
VGGERHYDSGRVGKRTARIKSELLGEQGV